MSAPPRPAIDQWSPRRLARIAGGLYLVNIVLGAFAIGVVPAIVIVAGDAAATARNIQANELLYRSGLLAHLIVAATNVPLAVIFYDLFKVVSRRLALLVVFFILVGTAVEGANELSQFSPLLLLSGSPYSTAMTAEQLQALAYVPLQLQSISYDINEVFFGFYAVTIGYLVFKSTFLPRAVGVLMVIDGLSYMTYSFSHVLAPEFAAHLVPWVQIPVLLGEGSLCVTLLAIGVNLQHWNARAAEAGMTGAASPKSAS